MLDGGGAVVDDVVGGAVVVDVSPVDVVVATSPSQATTRRDTTRSAATVIRGPITTMMHGPSRNVSSMCRSIKTLRVPDGPPTQEEVEAAALQYVRKVSGYRSPSKANRQAFERAVAEVAASTTTLLETLVVRGSA